MGKSIKDRLIERYENSRLKNPDLIKYPTQNKIPATQNKDIINRIKNISLVDWAAIATILSLIIAIWIYVLQPFFK